MKKLFALSFCLLISHSLYADDFNFEDKEQMRDYIIAQCSPDKAEICTCIANKLSDSFTKIDWQLFVAVITKDESIKEIVTEQDIRIFANKLDDAIIACDSQDIELFSFHK